jgi:hypothetical protein
VGPERFELSTSRLSSARSNQLSYGPKPRSRPNDPRPSTLPRMGSPHAQALVREERETETAGPAYGCQVQVVRDLAPASRLSQSRTGNRQPRRAIRHRVRSLERR